MYVKDRDSIHFGRGLWEILIITQSNTDAHPVVRAYGTVALAELHDKYSLATWRFWQGQMGRGLLITPRGTCVNSTSRAIPWGASQHSECLLSPFLHVLSCYSRLLSIWRSLICALFVYEPKNRLCDPGFLWHTYIKSVSPFPCSLLKL